MSLSHGKFMSFHDPNDLAFPASKSSPTLYHERVCNDSHVIARVLKCILLYNCRLGS